MQMNLPDEKWRELREAVLENTLPLKTDFYLIQQPVVSWKDRKAAGLLHKMTRTEKHLSFKVTTITSLHQVFTRESRQQIFLWV